MNRADYLHTLQGLLPQGQAWTRDPGAVLTTVLDVMASELARVDTRAAALIEESDPRTVEEMLEAWETAYGLPDPCSGTPDTIAERRLVLTEKVTRRGGQSIAYYLGIAEGLGYEGTEIKEYRPFICGLSACGDELSGGPDVRFYWKVSVPGPRLSYFRAGISRCGEKLLSVARAIDLECVLTRLKPAHTTLIFSYEGV